MHCRLFRVSAARPHFKTNNEEGFRLGYPCLLALVPHGGANLILTMVRRACRTQYNYMFIVRSSRCGIKCHKQADILLVCCYECYRNMEASFALLYRAGRQLPVSECALLLPVPDISHILLLPFRFVCFRCFVRCFLYSCYIKYTDKPLIYDCTSFAVGMRHPRDGNGS